MNTPRIDCQEQIQQNHGFRNDYGFEFSNCSSQFFGTQQPWNMGISPQLPPAMEGGGSGSSPSPTSSSSSQHKNFRLAKSSSTIMSRFETPASAFYATERFMGFPQHEYEVGNPSLGSQFSKNFDSQIPSTYQSPRDSFSIDSIDLADPNFQFKNTLELVTKPQLYSNQYYTSEKSYKVPCSNLPVRELLLHDQHKLISDSPASIGRHLSIPYDANEDLRVCHNPINSPLAQLSFSSQQEKQFSRPSPANSVSTGAVLSSKSRIRWTQDLHEKFVECVNRLGGAEKATPKAILKLMDSDGLTIFHVKSHLQKYRIAKYMPEYTEGKSERRNSMHDVPQLDPKTGMQLKEALQLQLDVQRRLHEQLEIQRTLQLRIEAQGKQLKMMFDQQQKTNNCLFNMPNLDTMSSDDLSVNLDDAQISIDEGLGNSHFPSKIS